MQNIPNPPPPPPLSFIRMENLDDERESETQSLTMNRHASSDSPEYHNLILKFRISLFSFGMINNVIYVIINSAALDLVPPNTPKGIILFCNIFPAFVAKFGWPYILKGRIRYTRRIIGACVSLMLGMMLVAASPSLSGRLTGIAFASFASGLGEITYLQLATTYAPTSKYLSSMGVSYFSSGTGGAGLLGGWLWWFLRSLGVKKGVGISSLLPLTVPFSYFFILPPPKAFSSFEFTRLRYTALSEHDDEESARSLHSESNYSTVPDLNKPPFEISPSSSEKWLLVKPLILRYMLPLFSVYAIESTIGQGIIPTLVFTPPSESSFLHYIIQSSRDFYPLWMLIVHSSVFLSRSALTLGIPPLPSHLLFLPVLIQFFVFLTLFSESAFGFIEHGQIQINRDLTKTVIILTTGMLVGMVGICGGLTYVNAFYHVGREPPTLNPSKSTLEREFKMGSIGFADTLGIVFASFLAIPMEVWLCNIQVKRGKGICKGL